MEGPLQIEWPATKGVLESFLLPEGAFEHSFAVSSVEDGGRAHVARGNNVSVGSSQGITQEVAGEETVVEEERSAAAAEDAAAAEEETAAADEMLESVHGGTGPHARILAAVAAASALQAVAAAFERLLWLHLGAGAEAVDKNNCTSYAGEVRLLCLLSY